MSEIDAHPVANLGLVAHAYQPETLSMEALNQSGTFPVFGANGIIGRHDNFNHEQPQVVIACRGNTCGAVNRTLPKSWINGNAMVINPYAEKLRKDFLFYVLEIADYSLVITGSAQPQIIRDSLYRLRVPLPPLETQQRIADYLDRETAEIDAAVADLDKYVELLEQRRLFTVDEVLNSNEAVTSEWTEMSLKFVIRERFVGDWGGEPGTAEVDSVCVRVADFDRPTNTVNDQVPTTRSYSRAKYEAKRLQHHDILVERSGGGDKTPVGSAMLYTGGDEALCANFIEVVRLKEDQLPEYWVHILRREYMGRNTMRFVKQTTGIQNLDPQSFYDQKFPVPSLNEQHSLAEKLRQRTSEIDSLIAESTRLRDLLLKRRSVLITEVVTGRKRV